MAYTEKGCKAVLPVGFSRTLLRSRCSGGWRSVAANRGLTLSRKRPSGALPFGNPPLPTRRTRADPKGMGGETHPQRVRATEARPPFSPVAQPARSVRLHGLGRISELVLVFGTASVRSSVVALSPWSGPIG